MNSDQLELCFVYPLPNEYECPICGQVLRYPVQFDQCGHHVCSQCLPTVIRLSARCPVDDIIVQREKVYVDKALQKTIQALTVKCPFHQAGCGWQARLVDLQEHVQECEYALVVCPKGCGTVLERGMIQGHQCQGQEKELHRPDPQCPFSLFGCEYKEEYDDDRCAWHLSLLCDGVNDLRGQLSEARSRVDHNKVSIDQLMQKLNTIDTLYGPQMVWKICNYQHNYNQAKSDHKSIIFSPTFATGKYGYKMALSACLYGDGPAKGKYLSLYVCICKGEHDSLLQWPFGHRIVLTLLDQCQDPAGRRDITYTLTPNTCKQNQPFLARPIGQRNPAFGAQRFCQLQALQTLDYVRDDTMFIKVQVNVENNTPL